MVERIGLVALEDVSAVEVRRFSLPKTLGRTGLGFPVIYVIGCATFPSSY